LKNCWKKKIPTSKVPGPWRDEAKSDKPNPLEIKMEETRQQRIKLLEEKHGRIVQNAARAKNKKHLQQHEKDSYNIMRKKNPQTF